MPEEKRRTLLDRLRTLSDAELANELANERQKLFDLRRQNITRQLGNTDLISQTKKQIARMLTLQKERETKVGKE